MRPEHDARFRRIAENYLARPGGDYAELLRRGQVSSPDGVDPEQWRAEIRAKARADKIDVVTIRDGDRAVAARQRSIPKDQERAELTRELDRSAVLQRLAERARQLGHEIERWLRHEQENIAICTRCPAASMPGLTPPPRSWTAKRSTTPAEQTDGPLGSSSPEQRAGHAASAVTGIHTSAWRPRSGWRVSRRSRPASSSTERARSISRRFLVAAEHVRDFGARHARWALLAGRRDLIGGWVAEAVTEDPAGGLGAVAPYRAVRRRI